MIKSLLDGCPRVVQEAHTTSWHIRLGTFVIVSCRYNEGPPQLREELFSTLLYFVGLAVDWEWRSLRISYFAPPSMMQ